MNKRAILVHQWSGNPQSDWYPWAKQQLEKLGYTVLLPEMPDTNNPQITPWVRTLKSTVGEVNEHDVVIGHSIGCQTILRFLEAETTEKKADKVILVAPWLKLTNLSSEEAQTIAKPWIETSIDFAKIIPKAKEFIAVFSDNDKYVPYTENVAMFQEKLHPTIITEHQKGHFSESDGVKELPLLLASVS